MRFFNINRFFGRTKATDVVFVAETDNIVHQLLSELGVESPKPKRLRFFQALGAVHRYWWSEAETTVAGAAGAVAGAGVAVIAAAVGAAGAAAVVAAVVAAVAVAAVAVGAAVADKDILAARKLLTTAFYLLLISTALLLIAPVPWWANGFFPFLGLTWLAQAFDRMIKSRRETEKESSPTSLEELHKLALGRLKDSIEEHRQRALAADSGFASRVAHREGRVEKVKGMIIQLEQMREDGEDEDFIVPRLEHLATIVADITEDIERITGGKQDLLDKLRKLEAHLPRFEKFFSRRTLDQEIVQVSQEAAGFAEDTERFLEQEIQAFRQDAALLIRALEQIALGAVEDERVSISETIEHGEQVGEAVSSASKVISA